MTEPAALSATYTATVINGWIPAPVDKLLHDTVARAEGKKIVLSVKPFTKKRSNPQNAFYWGVVIPLVRRMFEDAGNTIDDEAVHCFLRAHVGGLKQMIHTPDGQERNVLRSSTNLSTTEFMDYMEKIRAWAAGFELIIPLPNEADYE